MGYMTNVTLLNDHWDRVEKNPQMLVDAISEGMHDGTEGPWHEESVLRYGRDYDSEAKRWARVNYVTVHKSEHADTPQIIYAEANSAWPVHELPWVIGRGQWLESKSNPRTYIRIFRGIVNKLRWYADQLETELDAAEKRLDAAEVE